MSSRSGWSTGRLSFTFFFLLALLLLGGHKPAQASSYRDLLVFGDSLSDNGNHAARNGKDGGQVVSGSDYYPWQAYANGSFSNGPVWGERLAGLLGLPSLQPSALGGGNYAYAFAKVLAPGAAPPYSLPEQVKQYLARVGGVADPEALYVLEGGANDLFFNRGTAWDSTAAKQLSTRYANAVGAMVDKLQAAGAKHIVVMNVPNLGLAPGVSGEGAWLSSNASFLAQAMNKALSQRLAQEGPEVQSFDFYGLWTHWRAAGVGVSGFGNLTDACGAPSANCDAHNALFWDAIHPTAHGHAAMAAALYAQVSQVPEPAGWLLLSLGWLVLRPRERSSGPLARGGQVRG